MNNKLMTLEQVRQELDDRRIDLVSNATNISRSTLSRIREGCGMTAKTYITLVEYILRVRGADATVRSETDAGE